MKLILELDPTDINLFFKESYDANQIHLHQLDIGHFNYDVVDFWFNANEIWFYSREYIGDTIKIQLK